MAEEEEELDYLSDKFVVNPACDIRPGLLFRAGQKRHHEMAKKTVQANKKSYTKPLRVLEEEKRNEALDSAISPTNKGFAMLQKMGYKPGMAIGKQDSRGTSPKDESLQEPIRPVVKNNRYGLGQEAHQRLQIEEKVHRMKERHMQQVRNVKKLSSDFQARIRCKRRTHKVSSDLRQSQKVCLHLDSQANNESPREDWYWPVEMQEQSKEEEEKEDCSEEPTDEEEIIEMKTERLKLLTTYLRETYFYCLWCGTSYNDAEDLVANCPGPTAESHE